MINKKNMKIRMVKSLLVLVMLGASFFSWWAIDRAINVPDTSVWLVPILWMSLFFVSAYINIIAIKRIVLLRSLFLLSYVSSFIFVANGWHVIGCVLTLLLTFWTIARIKKDLYLNVEINIWKSVHAGSGILIFALALIITSQYYLAVRSLDAERLIPQFYISSLTGSLTSKFLAATNPKIKDLDHKNLTLDQFILQTQSGEVKTKEISFETNMQIDQLISRTNPSASEAQKKILKEDAMQKIKSASVEIRKEQENLLLAEGRNQFSEMAGKTFIGSEKVSDVLADIVNKKINQYFGAKTDGNNKTSTLPYIMAIGLFLTVAPMGSILNNLWILITQFFIWIFIQAGILGIKKVSVEVEVLE